MILNLPLIPVAPSIKEDGEETSQSIYSQIACEPRRHSLFSRQSTLQQEQ